MSRVDTRQQQPATMKNEAAGTNLHARDAKRLIDRWAGGVYFLIAVCTLAVRCISLNSEATTNQHQENNPSKKKYVADYCVI